MPDTGVSSNAAGGRTTFTPESLDQIRRFCMATGARHLLPDIMQQLKHAQAEPEAAAAPERRPHKSVSAYLQSTRGQQVRREHETMPSHGRPLGFRDDASFPSPQTAAAAGSTRAAANGAAAPPRPTRRHEAVAAAATARERRVVDTRPHMPAIQKPKASDPLTRPAPPPAVRGLQPGAAVHVTSVPPDGGKRNSSKPRSQRKARSETRKVSRPRTVQDERDEEQAAEMDRIMRAQTHGGKRAELPANELAATATGELDYSSEVDVRMTGEIEEFDAAKVADEALQQLSRPKPQQAAGSRVEVPAGVAQPSEPLKRRPEHQPAAEGDGIPQAAVDAAAADFALLGTHTVSARAARDGEAARVHTSGTADVVLEEALLAPIDSGKSWLDQITHTKGRNQKKGKKGAARNVQATKESGLADTGSSQERSDEVVHAEAAEQTRGQNGRVTADAVEAAELVAESQEGRAGAVQGKTRARPINPGNQVAAVAAVLAAVNGAAEGGRSAPVESGAAGDATEGAADERRGSAEAAAAERATADAAVQETAAAEAAAVARAEAEVATAEARVDHAAQARAEAAESATGVPGKSRRGNAGAERATAAAASQEAVAAVAVAKSAVAAAELASADAAAAEDAASRAAFTDAIDEAVAAVAKAVEEDATAAKAEEQRAAVARAEAGREAAAKAEAERKAAAKAEAQQAALAQAKAQRAAVAKAEARRAAEAAQAIQERAAAAKAKQEQAAAAKAAKKQAAAAKAKEDRVAASRALERARAAAQAQKQAAALEQAAQARWGALEATAEAANASATRGTRGEPEGPAQAVECEVVTDEQYAEAQKRWGEEEVEERTVDVEPMSPHGAFAEVGDGEQGVWVDLDQLMHGVADEDPELGQLLAGMSDADGQIMPEAMEMLMQMRMEEEDAGSVRSGRREEEGSGGRGFGGSATKRRAVPRKHARRAAERLAEEMLDAAMQERKASGAGTWEHPLPRGLTVSDGR